MPRRYRDYTDFIFYYNKIRRLGSIISLIRTFFFFFIVLIIVIEKKEILWSNNHSVEIKRRIINYHINYSLILYI